ncbi:hypothetical protein C8E05_4720 [Rhodococcus wratislaviensis]|uniref:ASCH domain-containing protein n=1 Tax=Rhodococcus wratislaviensis TaxID=44752 RepID=A0AB38FE32_RHOWR|nr:hypothetical protein [Rhodococcus wratislaviensis]REE75264.1 hypothetical protein C8E05_4720 [Rhodococcus wratislaviensis]SPZ39708.1 Uncharacterised protein [Rhodococcus wratislaviensis]
MILPQKVAQGVADGTVTVAFRRWAAPRVLEGSEFHTVSGMVRISSVTTVDPDGITEDDARRAGAASVAEALAALRGAPGQPVYRIGLEWVGEDPRVVLSSDDDLADDTIAEIGQSLERLDTRSSHGPWTRTILQLVADNPGRRAPDLAESLGRETQPFKRDVRKLKNLGLTHSLDVGYRISPRGAAYLAATAPDDA